MLELSVLMFRPHQSAAVSAGQVAQAFPAPGARGMTAADIERLVERSQQGDKKAFGELYRQHLQPVYSYIRLQVQDDGAAEDLTQDVFMSVLRGIGGFRLGESFSPWLMRVAHNRVVN